LRGAATAEACPSGEEEIRLSRGKISGFPGMGVRPGAEVWIATPLGVVRFNDARIELEVTAPDPYRLRATIGSGRATFVSLPGVTIDGAPADAGTLEEVQIEPGAAFEARRAPVPLAQLLLDLLKTCARESEAAQEAGRKVIAGGPRVEGESLGQRAFRHVRARQRARAACEAVHATGGLKPGALDNSMLAKLSWADDQWKNAVPPP
jgi:hypothetical protein